MLLRKLEPKDAPRMLAWMHDADVVAELKANFREKTLEDCRDFIESSEKDEENIHFAAVDDGDMYMGTVSLKHLHRDWAEFAIVVCREAMGTGIAREAMARILDHGVRALGLARIYWCVSVRNPRAVRFYDKNGYARTETVPEELKALYREEAGTLLWYVYPAD